MRQFSIILLIFFLINCKSKTSVQNDSSIISSQKISIGHYDTITSKVYAKNILLQISVPSELGKCDGEKFPLVIVLDGSSHFYSLVGMIYRFSFEEGCEVTPKMIVVGVETTNRYEDLVPNFDNDKFSQFLQNEVIPYIDKNYPTLPYRILIGHSLAGLRVAHTSIYQTNLFNGYILIDPSLGELKNKWYSNAKEELKNINLKNRKIYVAMAQTMPKKRVQDLESIKKDTSGESNHMRTIMNFSEKMASKNQKDTIAFNWKFYPQETHASVTQIAMYDGLKFIFDYYLNKTWPEVLDAETTPEDALNIMIGYYKTVSKNIGNNTNPRERLFQMLDATFNRRKQFEKAKVFANYYLTCYPQSNEAKKLVEKYKINSLQHRLI